MSYRLIIVLVATAALGAVHASPAPQVLRRGVNLVLVDMRVLHGDEQVPDLRAEEVTLLVDGTPRPIVSLEYEPVATRKAAGGQRPAPGDPQQTPKAAGEAPAPRRIVLVVDSRSIPPGDGSRLFKAAQSFIDHLAPDDALAVATLPIARGIRFGTDRQATARVLADVLKRTSNIGTGLEGIAGFGCTGAAASAGCGEQGLPRGVDTARAREMNAAAESRMRAGAVLDDLRWVFHAIEDGPSDVVIITGGLPSQRSMRPDIERTIRIARTTRVRVHALEAADLSSVPLPEGGRPADASGVQNVEHSPIAFGLPAETGGIEGGAAVSGNRFFKRLARELAGSYVLSFAPLPQERDGQPHRIEIRTSRRPRPTIHARKVFVLEPGADRAAEPAAAGAPGGGGAGRSTPSAEAASAAGADGHRAAVETVNEASAGMPSRGMAGDSPLSSLLVRASTYVEHFQRTFSAVVMEERYVQVVKVWIGKPPEPGTEPELAWTSGTKEPSGARGGGLVRRRQLLSDVLLVQAAGQAWMGYRDVAEVDGRSVRDRKVRVQALFMSGRAVDRRQLQRIAQESARFNLGVGRNLNLPTFPLQALAATTLGRFAWTPYPDEPLDASCCAVVGLREVSSPTMVRTGDDHDLPMTGRVWMEPGTGRVRRALLQFGGPLDQVEGAFEVTYGAMDGIDVLIPTRLWEWYRRRDQAYLGLPAYVEGQAAYSDIRRFTVRTDQMIK